MIAAPIYLDIGPRVYRYMDIFLINTSMIQISFNFGKQQRAGHIRVDICHVVVFLKSAPSASGGWILLQLQVWSNLMHFFGGQFDALEDVHLWVIQ